VSVSVSECVNMYRASYRIRTHLIDHYHFSLPQEQHLIADIMELICVNVVATGDHVGVAGDAGVAGDGVDHLQASSALAVWRAADALELRRTWRIVGRLAGTLQKLPNQCVCLFAFDLV
jgi:hypothetical protein